MPISQSRRGFTILEILITVGCIAVLAAIAIGVYGKMNSFTNQVKLENDLKILNTAVKAYANFGGSLSDLETTETVINKLKSKATVDTARSVVGLSGSFLDPRLEVVMQTSEEATSNMARIYYDPENKQFVRATEGEAGIRYFTLNKNTGHDSQDEDTRTSVVQFSKVSPWIWDYTDVDSPPPLPGTTPVVTNPIPVGLDPTTTPTGAPTTTVPLQPPHISLPSGDYSYWAYDLSVTLNNYNPPGSSNLTYSLNNGAWQSYSGPISVPPNANLRAQANPLTPDWTSSSQAIADYGLLAGVLARPVITLSAPSFGESTPTINVVISNPNSSASSVLYYALRTPEGSYPPFGSYVAYTGTLTLDSTTYPDGFFVQAYAKSTDSTKWGDSGFAEDAAIANFFDIPLTGSKILFILDASGSMNSEFCSTGVDRFETTVSEVAAAISSLSASKQFGIAMFDGGQHWVYNGSALQVADSANKQAAISAVNAVSSDSGTNYEVGLAYPLQFTPQPDQVIFLSDGSPNSATGWHDELAALKAAGIRVDCVGVESDDAEKAVLEFIASETGGIAKFLDCGNVPDIRFSVTDVDLELGDTLRILDYIEAPQLKLGKDFEFFYDDSEGWHYTQFNTSSSITAVSADLLGGNYGPGEYRLSVRIIGITEPADSIIIRISEPSSGSALGSPIISAAPLDADDEIFAKFNWNKSIQSFVGEVGVSGNQQVAISDIIFKSGDEPIAARFTSGVNASIVKVKAGIEEFWTTHPSPGVTSGTFATENKHAISQVVFYQAVGGYSISLLNPNEAGSSDMEYEMVYTPSEGNPITLPWSLYSGPFSVNGTDITVTTRAVPSGASNQIQSADTNWSS